MIELTVLALLNRLMNWGRAPVIATRVIAADAHVLHSLVSDPANQARIVADVSARLRPRTQAGARSTARVIPVRVQLRGRDVLWLTWILTPARGTTEIDLAAQVESVFARLLLALGGRRRLEHRLATNLSHLARLAHCAAEDLDEIAGATAPATPTAATSIAS